VTHDDRHGRTDDDTAQPTDSPARTDGGPGGPGSSGPSLGRRLAVALLGLFLTLSLVAASGVFAAQGTVLSSDYVADKLDEADAPAAIETQAEDRILREVDTTVGATGSAFLPSVDGLIEPVVRDLITEAYVRDVLGTNLDRLYAYLNGETDRLRLGVDTTPIVENIAPRLREELATVPITDLLAGGAFDGVFSVSGYSVDGDQLARAYEDRSTFRELQSQVGLLVEQQGLTREELNRTVVDNTEGQVSGLPPDLQESVFDLERTFVYGFTSDISHAEFRERVNASRDDLYNATAAYAADQAAAEVPATIDIDEQLSASDRQAIDRAANTVGTVGTLGMVLPILALVFAALIGLVTHSVSRTARAVGTSLLAVGVLGYLGTTLAGSAVEGLIRGAVPAEGEQAFVAETVEALVDGFFAALTGQYAVLAVVGAVLLVLYVLIDRRQPAAVPAAWR
jgi:hypothetical protein